MVLAEELKNYTKSAHAALEGRMIPAIKSIRTGGDYTRLLRLFYGYYAALETKIAPQVCDKLPDFEARRKAQSILSDMAAIDGGSVAATTLCNTLPDITSYPQALGAMYVLEGSTLGGQIISNMIRQRLQEAGGALSFFEGYGEQTAAMWQRFKLLLEDDFSETEKAALLYAANDTFVSFQKWIAAHDAR
ncbi:biliverdin-producing heme oxygenase [Deminuibacter soli]|uniref:Biliverdin-producing heme oxygenase n=1 Tax=Deminuibacter soli TaxID=2291815 RepID=A0A3E1NPV8_9BACT|nr:biliverdin-producing heme oxygenase [Deminuibacter soli]RFM29966.1 biliverdin-producing heme oxygenase [Deminuibacter soli]